MICALPLSISCRAGPNERLGCLVVGAQNMHFAEEGANTGEISASMLCALGVSHVILGHSERRQYSPNRRYC